MRWAEGLNEDALVTGYAELIRVAAMRPVTSDDLRNAGVAEGAAGVAGYLDDVAGRRSYLVAESVETGIAVHGSEQTGDDAATIKANIGWEGRIADGTHSSGSDQHVLKVERREGSWVITADSVDYFPGGHD